MKKIYKLMCSPALSPFFTLLYNIFIVGQYRLLSVKWKLQGHGKPSPGEARAVSENVTFIYKSFESGSTAIFSTTTPARGSSSPTTAASRSDSRAIR